jgi:hypothetical protein
MCPFFRAENRLQDFQHYWANAAEAYQRPRDFIREIQVAIQQFRTVTFVLQDSKRKIPGFEPWYKIWQQKMASDSVLRWLKNMRNVIEKQGDLDAASKLRLTICLDWLSDETLEVDFPPSFTAEKAVNLYARKFDRSGSGEEALIRFQREWRHPGLKDFELLDALTHGYGFLLDLLLDGHLLLELAVRQECPFFADLASKNVKVPNNMRVRSNETSVWYRLKDRMAMSFSVQDRSFDREESEKGVSERYGFQWEDLHKGDTLVDKCKRYLQWGQYVLNKDGLIIPAFFIESENAFLPYAMTPRNRADKHAMFRLVADAVVANRAHTVFSLGEAWMSEVDLTGPPPSWEHAEDDPNRLEGIMVTGITRTGETVDAHCLFTRIDSKIQFGETKIVEGTHSNFMEPIRKAFLKVQTR